jgi:hypothetical protein
MLYFKSVAKVGDFFDSANSFSIKNG